VAVWTALYALWSLSAYSTLDYAADRLPPAAGSHHDGLRLSALVLEAFGVLTQPPTVGCRPSCCG
jgi:hypothetical protein